jgi:hypothetical protein
MATTTAKWAVRNNGESGLQLMYGEIGGPISFAEAKRIGTLLVTRSATTNASKTATAPAGAKSKKKMKGKGC